MVLLTDLLNFFKFKETHEISGNFSTQLYAFFAFYTQLGPGSQSPLKVTCILVSLAS